MRKGDELPDALRRSGFRYSDALAAGVNRRLLYGRDLERPFYGMRTSGIDLSDHVALCRAASTILPPDSFFSHRSAAVLHALPVPWRTQPRDVEVSVFEPARPPELHGIRAHQLASTGQRWTSVKGLNTIGPEDTWAHLSATLSVSDLVVIGDYLTTGDEPYSGKPPPSTLDQLADAVRRHGRRRGVRSLRSALEHVRYGSMSPQETRLRLALVDAGLPEPEPNHRVVDGRGRLLALVDLAYPAHMVAVEYLGDHHRTDSDVYRKDIARREMLVERGWFVILVTAGDRFPFVVDRVRRALLRSSPG